MVVVNNVAVFHSFVLNNALLCFVFWLLFVLCVVWFGFGGLFGVLCDFALLFVFGTCLRLEVLGVVSALWVLVFRFGWRGLACSFWCLLVLLVIVICCLVSGLLDRLRVVVAWFAV